MKTKLTLNVGSGDRTFLFYPDRTHKCINLDMRMLPNKTDIVSDVRQLPFPDDNFDYILASDIIEHFPIAQTEDVLEEWKRVLKPGCIIEFRLPNLEAIVGDYVKRKNEDRKDTPGVPIASYFSWLIFGGQDYEGNYHYVGFDRRFFKHVCGKVGLKEIDWKKDGYNMIVKMEN
jgi:predicted SAM-dependent methyltransferase